MDGIRTEIEQLNEDPNCRGTNGNDETDRKQIHS